MTERAVAKATRKDSPDNSPPPSDIDFEAAMGELETLVEKLEQGEFSLEESIRQFERGIELTRLCQNALRAAEQKVSRLAGNGDAATLEPFDLPEDD